MYSAVAGFPEGSRSHRCDVRETAGGADRSQANGEGDGRGETGKLGRNLLAKCLTWREKWAVASVPGVVMSKDHMGRTALHAAALGGMFIPLCTHVCAPYTFVALFSSQKCVRSKCEDVCSPSHVCALDCSSISSQETTTQWKFCWTRAAILACRIGGDGRPCMLLQTKVTWHVLKFCFPSWLAWVDRKRAGPSLGRRERCNWRDLSMVSVARLYMSGRIRESCAHLHQARPPERLRRARWERRCPCQEHSSCWSVQAGARFRRKSMEAGRHYTQVQRYSC
jgi:hypothetical protein